MEDPVTFPRPKSDAPEPASPKPETSAPPGRRRGHPPGKPLSEAELAARRANLRKAQAAPGTLTGRRTEKRRAASRANVQKAIAARKSPAGTASARLNALKHGMFAQSTLVESVARLGESPEAFGEHLGRFAQLFSPQDDEERALVQRLAETVWRRLRLHLAQAVRERERLWELFRSAPGARRLGVENTVRRADALTCLLTEFEAFFRDANKIESQIEHLLRELVRKRSGGEVVYRLFSPRRDPVPQRDADEPKDRRPA